jgi:hypothetical protein
VRSPRLVALGLLLASVLVGGIAFAASDSVRFVVCSTLGAILYGFPSDKDWSDAEDICEKIRSVHHFTRDLASKPGQAPVFSTAGSKQLLRNPTVIYVYDVQDDTEQNKIVSALEQLAADEHIPPFKVCFYDHENWIVSGNVGERGPENQLRCVRVTAGRARELSGPKVITYPIP